MNSYSMLARRMSAGFICVKSETGADMFVNTDMIVNVVEDASGGCVLNLYCGGLKPDGDLLYQPLLTRAPLLEIHEKIDQLKANNFLRIKGVNAIFNTDYSFHFSPENCATPIGLRLNVPGTEIYDQVDLVSLPPLQQQPEYHQLADSKKGTYWVHVNLILGLLSEGNTNYWHICLVGGKSVRVRGPLREIYESHPNLRNIPLVKVKDGILLNLNHTQYFNSGKNLIRLCDKVVIENTYFSQSEFSIEKADYKKAIRDFLHTGVVPEIRFRKRK